MIATILALTLGPDITLSGLVLSRSGRHAATLIAEGRVRPVVTGDQAFGCTVASIREGQVDIICGEERRTLTLTGAPSPPASTPAAAQTTASDDPPADVTITRADLQARLDLEMSRLMTETTLVPVTSRGQVSGFTLSRIPAGTILETLGLRAGDVLVSVDETPIDSFTTLVGLWPRLQSSGAVKAQVMRDGRPVDISVSIR